MMAFAIRLLLEAIARARHSTQVYVEGQESLRRVQVGPERLPGMTYYP